MNRIKIILFICLYSFFLVGFVYCKNGKTASKYVSEKQVKYEDKQLLLPDMVCPDTLIVVDGVSLTKELNDSLQNTGFGSDSDINNLLHKYCLTFEEYVKELEGIGYRSDIALHIAFVDFKILKPDSLYKAMMKD